MRVCGWACAREHTRACVIHTLTFSERERQKGLGARNCIRKVMDISYLEQMVVKESALYSREVSEEDEEMPFKDELKEGLP